MKPSFALTPKMQARYDNCPLISRSNKGCFAEQAQVQVSAELPMSYCDYTIGGAHHMIPSVWVRVSVPDFEEGWGYYDIPWKRQIPRPMGMSTEIFQARVDTAIEEAKIVALNLRGV